MHPAGLYNVYNYKNQRKYIGHISSFNAAEQNIEHCTPMLCAVYFQKT